MSLDLDIVHDLAVVKAPKAMGKVLDIDAIPEKGARLFSLGNPLDLGFKFGNRYLRDILQSNSSFQLPPSLPLIPLTVLFSKIQNAFIYWLLQ